MARRRRGHRRRMPNSSVILVQIVGLGLILLMILFFRDQIAGGAGKFLDGMGASEDVQVETDERKEELGSGPGSAIEGPP